MIRAILAAVLLFGITICDIRAETWTGRFGSTDRKLAEQATAIFEATWKDWHGDRQPIPWSTPCHLTLNRISTGSGGTTSFNFGGGQITEMVMSIQAATDKDVNTSLRHEVMHLVNVSRYGRPLARWFDEGLATLQEPAKEQVQYDTMLRQFLTTGRGIAFGEMLDQYEYRRDVMPTYAQGNSLVAYLLAHGGKDKLITAGESAYKKGWAKVLRDDYGFSTAQHAQDVWLAWARDGTRWDDKKAVLVASPKPETPMLVAANP